jgi:hypothetical protein
MPAWPLGSAGAAWVACTCSTQHSTVMVVLWQDGVGAVRWCGLECTPRVGVAGLGDGA